MLLTGIFAIMAAIGGLILLLGLASGFQVDRLTFNSSTGKMRYAAVTIGLSLVLIAGGASLYIAMNYASASSALNANAVASSIFSFIVAISTVVYAVLTGILVKETIKMRQAQTEPKVSVEVSLRETIDFIDLIIQNEGLGPAYNIKFAVNPDFDYGPKRVRFSDTGLIERGLRYLGSGGEKRFMLNNVTSTAHPPMPNLPETFEITVEYENSTGKRFKDIYPIDLAEWADLLQTPSKQYLKEIANGIGSIKSSIDFMKRDIGHGLHTIAQSAQYQPSLSARSLKEYQRQSYQMRKVRSKKLLLLKGKS